MLHPLSGTVIALRTTDVEEATSANRKVIPVLLVYDYAVIRIGYGLAFD